MSYPISWFVWFTDEIRGVGSTAGFCRADAHARCLEEHAAYAADTGADPTIERLEGCLAALAESGVVELHVESDAERACVSAAPCRGGGLRSASIWRSRDPTAP